MTLALTALAASYVAIFATGVIAGVYLDHRPRRAPDHPVLRIHHDEPPKRWRVIEGGLQRPNALYDWQQHDEGRRA